MAYKNPEFKHRDKLTIRFLTEKGQDVLSEWWYQKAKEQKEAGVNSVAEDLMVEAMKNDLENKKASTSMISQELDSQANLIVSRLSSLMDKKIKDLYFEILKETDPSNAKLNLLLSMIGNKFGISQSLINSPEKVTLKPPTFEYEIKAEIDKKKRQK